ncbi:hypothetical protein NLG97_g1265 [Lecanicillium saksenae]|uniref:Uncharacterized protein n=1 Tax=Lecanicillium saksenae TaxID=468837 RepID=A0ACC1R8C2_9HYPO|nr:hypothetical protein NLG97_g1265 [Lecanicillium saksenae]
MRVANVTHVPLEIAEQRLKEVLFYNGHTSLLDHPVDVQHPLHNLWLDTLRLLRRLCVWSDAEEHPLDAHRREVLEAVTGLVRDPQGLRTAQVLQLDTAVMAPLRPSRAAMLALRLASPVTVENIEILKLLHAHNALHLYHVLNSPASSSFGSAIRFSPQTPTESISSYDYVRMLDEEDGAPAMAEAGHVERAKELMRKAEILQQQLNQTMEMCITHIRAGQEALEGRRRSVAEDRLQIEELRQDVVEAEWQLEEDGTELESLEQEANRLTAQLQRS